MSDFSDGHSTVLECQKKKGMEARRLCWNGVGGGGEQTPCCRKCLATLDSTYIFVKYSMFGLHFLPLHYEDMKKYNIILLGSEKPSSPRLTLRFQSIRNKELKNNPVGSSSKCLPGVVSSTEPKYQSYFVTMESKDDVYEFKQDTPPPVSLSASRTINPLTSVSEACDSQTELINSGKDCDSSTIEKLPINSSSSNTAKPTAEKSDVLDIRPSSVNTNVTTDVESAFKSEANSAIDEEVIKKKRKESDSPVPYSLVSSTSKQSIAGTADSVASPSCDDLNSTSKPLVVDSSADVISSSDKNISEVPSVSSSVSPPIPLNCPGSCSSGSGSSSPKVPPLKIVIPQSSEQDSKDKNKTNNLRQALPYVVNSTAAGDSTETILYSASNSETTDSARVTFSKLPEIQSTNSETTPERTSQRVTRSLHRMQAAMANVNQTGAELNNESLRNPDLPEEPPSQNIEAHPRKRKLRSRDPNSNSGNNINSNTESNQSSASSTSSHDDQPVQNSYHMFLDIRRQVAQRRQGLIPVQPKAPQGFKDYLLNKCSYVIEGNHASRTAVPILSTPLSLSGALKDLFEEQERERYTLRLQQIVEKEKLILSAEQEILRVYTRAARATVNQTVPLSMCTILRDEEIYNSFENEQEEKDKNVRSRYNGRLFLSWIQDVNEKWDRIKNAMLLRHHNEAEALHAVQKMSWEWKMKSLGVCDAKTTPVIDNVIVPMVYVGDEFDVLPQLFNTVNIVEYSPDDAFHIGLHCIANGSWYKPVFMHETHSIPELLERLEIRSTKNLSYDNVCKDSIILYIRMDGLTLQTYFNEWLTFMTEVINNLFAIEWTLRCKMSHHNKILCPLNSVCDCELFQCLFDYRMILTSIESIMEYKQNMGRDWEPEVRRRVALGWQAFGRLNNVWRSKLPLCLKRKLSIENCGKRLLKLRNIGDNKDPGEEINRCLRGLKGRRPNPKLP
ncbi:Ankyrin repeat domain-containing protein 12 [Nymphon striatum]|nr:Ankyrin repeat domain-containing protein 12 [Nymphon striatum]